jgi:hypothetical protein
VGKIFHEIGVRNLFSKPEAQMQVNYVERDEKTILKIKGFELFSILLLFLL